MSTISYTLPSGKQAIITVEGVRFSGNGKVYAEVRAEVEGGTTQVGDPTRPANLPAWAVSAIGRLPLTAEVDAQVTAAIAAIDADCAEHNAAAEAHLATIEAVTARSEMIRKRMAY